MCVCTVNCLDRHDGSKLAICWEPPDKESEKLTYRFVETKLYSMINFILSLSIMDRQLLEMTCKVANVLKEHGITRGDRVIIYMPAIPLTVASMLACARMGAVHW